MNAENVETLVRAADIAQAARDEVGRVERCFLEEYVEHAGTPVGDFMDRVLEWYQSKDDRKQLLWEMFHEVFDLDHPGLFLDTFHGFVVNCLLDDDAFVIEWRRLVFTSKGHVVWAEDGSPKTQLSDEADPKTTPVVVRHSDGRQDPALLLHAMDVALDREKQRQDALDDFQNRLTKPSK